MLVFIKHGADFRAMDGQDLGDTHAFGRLGIDPVFGQFQDMGVEQAVVSPAAISWGASSQPEVSQNICFATSLQQSLEPAYG